MSFNLYFAGGSSDAYVEYMREHKLLRLLSYLNDKRSIDKWITQGGKLFVDSGAFSAHTKGAEIDIDDYINYVNERDENIIIYAELDKIPGEYAKPKTQEQLAEAPIISWENYLYMRDKVVSVDKCLPIFHQGEDFKYLDNMLEARFHGSLIPYIGISPANDICPSGRERWCVEVFRHIKNSSNPSVMTHAFGLTALPILERIPFTSADSTRWVLSAAYGRLLSPFGDVTVSETSKFKKDHIDYMAKEEQDIILKMIKEAGFTLKQLSEETTQRGLWNMYYLSQWAKNYKYNNVYDFKKQNRLF